MPLTRRTDRPEPAKKPIPPPRTISARRIFLVALLIDRSGSMKPYLNTQVDFITSLYGSVKEAGGPSTSDFIYVCPVHISGGAFSSGFAPFGRGAEPECDSGGHTPLGAGFKVIVQQTQNFLTQEVYPAECSVKGIEVLLFSDFHPTEEAKEVTNDGADLLRQFAKDYRAKIKAFAPDSETVNYELLERLGISKGDVNFLAKADPKAVIKIAADSIVNASRIIDQRRNQK